MSTIAVINYGAGNLPNAVRALQYVGADVVITEDPAVVEAASVVILPGVGATQDTMRSLSELGMSKVLPAYIASGRPFLGICVGMQVLLEYSEEFGLHNCLGSIPGTVRMLPPGQKVPQIGWNQVRYSPEFANHALFKGIPDQSDFYFVHSFYCDVPDKVVAGRTTYGVDFPSVIIQNRLAAVQFHPEKSGRWGLKLLENFISWATSQNPISVDSNALESV
jgi:imidazole glycerol phosphate synthase, glutamine amidotransferase subunit